VLYHLGPTRWSRHGGDRGLGRDRSQGTGLRVPSVVRFDKLATLDRSVIAGRLGAAPGEWLVAHSAEFFAVFGFELPTSTP